MSDTITIEGRFCGPPGMGNGGYVCGKLAAYVDGPAEVTLRRPTPLDRPLAVVREAGLARLMDGDAVLAEARPASRSEEHTSELQSPMRKSYAVFCLQKQNN